MVIDYAMADEKMRNELLNNLHKASQDLLKQLAEVQQIQAQEAAQLQKFDYDELTESQITPSSTAANTVVEVKTPQVEVIGAASI